MCATFQHWQFVNLQEEGIVGCPGAGEVVGPGKGRAAWGRGRERQEGGFGGGGGFRGSPAPLLPQSPVLSLTLLLLLGPQER